MNIYNSYLPKSHQTILQLLAAWIQPPAPMLGIQNNFFFPPPEWPHLRAASNLLDSSVNDDMRHQAPSLKHRIICIVHSKKEWQKVATSHCSMWLSWYGAVLHCLTRSAKCMRWCQSTHCWVIVRSLGVARKQEEAVFTHAVAPPKFTETFCNMSLISPVTLPSLKKNRDAVWLNEWIHFISKRMALRPKRRYKG